jgi:hypothetical protein
MPQNLDKSGKAKVLSAYYLCDITGKTQEIFDFPYFTHSRILPERVKEITDALSEAPNLKIIILRHAHLFTSYLPIMARNPSLQAIRVPVAPGLETFYRNQFDQLKSEVTKDKLLRGLVQFDYPVQAETPA